MEIAAEGDLGVNNGGQHAGCSEKSRRRHNSFRAVANFGGIAQAEALWKAGQAPSRKDGGQTSWSAAQRVPDSALFPLYRSVA